MGRKISSRNKAKIKYKYALTGKGHVGNSIWKRHPVTGAIVKDMERTKDYKEIKPRIQKLFQRGIIGGVRNALNIYHTKMETGLPWRQ